MFNILFLIMVSMGVMSLEAAGECPSTPPSRILTTPPIPSTPPRSDRKRKYNAVEEHTVDNTIEEHAADPFGLKCPEPTDNRTVLFALERSTKRAKTLPPCSKEKYGLKGPWDYNPDQDGSGPSGQPLSV